MGLRHRKQETGFSLVEVLVAVIIISGSLLLLANALLVGAASTGQFTLKQRAVRIAGQQLEAVGSLKYDQIALTSTSNLTGNPADPTSAGSLIGNAVAEYTTYMPSDVTVDGNGNKLLLTDPSTVDATGANIVNANNASTIPNAGGSTANMRVYTYVYYHNYKTPASSPACTDANTSCTKVINVKVAWNERNGRRQVTSVHKYTSAAAARRAACS